MHFSNTLAISIAILPALIEGHDDGMAGMPKLFGRRSVQELRERQAFARRMPARAMHEARAAVVERATTGNVDGQCGSGFGSCAAGYCCSAAGWCGNTEDYCAAPDCQINYGTGCDSLQVPPGPVTSKVVRTKVGSVPYGGVGVYDCTVNGEIAITYDDGPYIYTSHILDIHKSYSAPATFFVTGNNLAKGQIDNAALPWPALIQRMYAEGHQIASHTWGHQDLSAITQVQRLNQMYYNEIAFNNILGFFPTYMRPPFSSCTTACQNDMATLGYHIIYFDLDTEDYLMDNPSLIQNSKNFFLGNISTASAATSNWLSISHDIHQQTAYNLTDYMLSNLLAKGFKPVTVGQCLGDPAANWYRALGGGKLFTSTVSQQATTSSSVATSSSASATGSKTSSATGPLATKITDDGTCGAAAGKTCLGSTLYGNCCSVNGWCGSTSAYCGTGCQPGYGSCGLSSSSSASASSTGPAASSGPKVISTDGSCGGAGGMTCQGSTFGNCCSQFGWCGSATNYCSTGCQSAFGTCAVSGVTSSSSSALPTTKSSSTITTTKTSSSTKSSSTVT